MRETSPRHEKFFITQKGEDVEAITWLDGKVRLLDQARLPQHEAFIETADYRVVATAIRELKVRGAPLIGIAAAYGLALAAQEIEATDKESFLARLGQAAQELASTRPTAVNLSWALKRLLARAEHSASPNEAQRALVAEATRLHREDIENNRRLGAIGAELLPQGAAVLTHCNTGWLATGGYGTALGVIRAAWERGKLTNVYVSETRPLMQGVRLTAWELARDGIPLTLIVDSAAGSLLRQGKIAAVVVGADRIAANGDVANKIGTYSLAVLAQENNVPFYVAAPTSTIDLSLADGDEIPIEERSASEITSYGNLSVAPAGIEASNPAFDVTPHSYVTAIITENGLARAPYIESLVALMKEGSYA